MSTAKPHAMLTAIILAICRNTKTPAVQYLPSNEVVISGIHPSDEGRLIGKKGTVFRAMATLHFFACRALGLEQRVIQPLETNERIDIHRSAKFLPKMDWDKTPVTDLIESVLSTCYPTAAWAMERDGEDITVRIQISKALKPDPLDPSFEIALDTVIHGAGKSCGVSLHTIVSWV